MRKTISINGIEFELYKPDSCIGVRFVSGAVYDEIYEVYDRPSYYKVEVWHEWCRWCFACCHGDIPCTLRISSHNCMQFSISGFVLFEGHTYKIWITRNHNRAFKLD